MIKTCVNKRETRQRKAECLEAKVEVEEDKEMEGNSSLSFQGHSSFLTETFSMETDNPNGDGRPQWRRTIPMETDDPHGGRHSEKVLGGSAEWLPPSPGDQPSSTTPSPPPSSSPSSSSSCLILMSGWVKGGGDGGVCLCC